MSVSFNSEPHICVYVDEGENKKREQPDPITSQVVNNQLSSSGDTDTDRSIHKTSHILRGFAECVPGPGLLIIDGIATLWCKIFEKPEET